MLGLPLIYPLMAATGSLPHAFLHPIFRTHIASTSSRFRFRYVLHPWTAKYSHWMWHWAIAFCQSDVNSNANSEQNSATSHLVYSVVSLISGQRPSQDWCLRLVV
jgi:hypothetical protein